MKKILILIHDMRIGGAQKSLLSFLQCLSASELRSEYEVDLMVMDPAGAFLEQIPEYVRILPPPEALRWCGTGLSKTLFLKHFTMSSFWGECSWLIRKTLKSFDRGLNLQQRLWESWHKRIPALQTHYDVAVSYMDGVPNYYVSEKVSADKTVLWVHSEYQKQGYDPAYDRRFFEKAHGIVTISENCRQCILKDFPDLQHKLFVLENITFSRTVIEKSNLSQCPEFQGIEQLKLLTVARLNLQKGIDLAVEAAGILKQKGIAFLWLVAGDGPEREALQAQIDQVGLNEQFRLLGSRENPYSYMKACDILVQPSRVEGRSIVLDEAKVLCKPIVATNYTTVVDSLIHGKTGWIVEMTPEGIAGGIHRIYDDCDLRNTLIQNLLSAPKGNEQELQKYITVML